jgi:hypothetical protein
LVHQVWFLVAAKVADFRWFRAFGVLGEVASSILVKTLSCYRRSHLRLIDHFSLFLLTLACEVFSWWSYLFHKVSILAYFLFWNIDKWKLQTG